MKLAQDLNNQQMHIAFQNSQLEKSTQEWEKNMKNNSAWTHVDRWNVLRKKHDERSAETASLYEKQIASSVKLTNILGELRDKTSSKLGGSADSIDLPTFHR